MTQYRVLASEGQKPIKKEEKKKKKESAPIYRL
jgi:hypothetical protein